MPCSTQVNSDHLKHKDFSSGYLNVAMWHTINNRCYVAHNKEGIVPNNMALCQTRRHCAKQGGIVPNNKALCQTTRMHCAKQEGIVPNKKALCQTTRRHCATRSKVCHVAHIIPCPIVCSGSERLFTMCWIVNTLKCSQ